MNHPVEGVVVNQFDNHFDKEQQLIKPKGENEFQRKANEFLKNANVNAFKIDEINTDEI